MKSAPLFESSPCARCFGSGQYGRFGVCFLCGGVGYKLTGRGQAAQNFLNQRRLVRAEDFRPGDLILSEGFTAGSLTVLSKWNTVERVEHVKGSECGYTGEAAERDCVRITTDAGVFVGGAETLYRRGQTKAEKAALRAEALAYQATLTKAGTVAKAKRAAVSP